MTSGRTIRSAVLLAPLLAACAVAPETREHLGTTDQRFTSEEAVLLDFEFDGRLIGEANISDPKPFIEVQLMYTIGQLSGDRAAGRFEKLELSNIAIHPTPDQAEVTYHARLPVAWGAPSIPTTCLLTVPSRVAEDDQIRFADLYGESCVDESVGAVDAGGMFLYFRPQRTDCHLDPNDVVTSTATVKLSADNTTGKYPEYHRIWEDGALDVVAMFSRAEEQPSDEDVGALAYEAFVQEAQEYLRSIQPHDPLRTTTAGTTDAAPQMKLGATLPDGRSVTIDAMLVDYRIREDDANFDRWYDALTPKADLILYNGHAGLGENVRTLMQKGTFVPRKYAIWAVNSCNTFAYVDQSLATRRALLNPDDPLGTKYMDTVSNVLAGYFETTSETSMTFIEAIIAAGAKQPTEPRAEKTYQEIFSSVDPDQIVVVTGEEDNEFQPGMAQPSSADPAPDTTYVPPLAPSDARAKGDDGGGCAAGGRGGNSDGIWGWFGLLGLVVIAARRRLRTTVLSDAGAPR